MKFISVSVILVLATSFAFAAPNPTGTTAYTHGASITVSGTDFGTNVDIGDNVYLGGVSGFIESGTNGVEITGTLPSGFSSLTPYYKQAEFDTSQAYSGSKSIQFFRLTAAEMSAGGYTAQYSSPIIYDYGSGGFPDGTAYLTFWRRWNAGTANCNQNKVFRIISQANSVNDHDIPDMYGTVYSGNNLLQSYCDSSLSCSGQCYPGVEDCNDSFAVSIWPKDKWIRFEVWYEENSGVGNSDGTFQFWIHDPAGSTLGTIRDWDGDLLTRTSGATNPKRGFVIQGYLGNGCADGNQYVWYDDIAIYQNQARVELGDASTWSTCTFRTLQNASSWDSTSITIEGDTTGHTTGGYLYVVDSNGNHNTNGLSVSFGSDTTAPTVSSASVNDTTVTINFSESVDTSGYDSGDFDMDCTTAGSDIVLSSPSGAGSVRTFTSATAVEYGDTCNLDYTGSTDDIEDTAGNDLAVFSNTSVTVNTPQAGDSTPPVISNVTIEGETAVSPWDAQNTTVSFAGECADETGLRVSNPIVVTCADCASVGSVTGSTNWSFDITPSVSTADGTDQLNADGSFSTSAGWWINDAVWTLSGGAISADGDADGSFTALAGFEVGKTYKVYYTITAYTSGNLAQSQYGFQGEPTLWLDTSVGIHSYSAECVDDSGIIMFWSDNFYGTIDDVSVHELGTSNVVEIKCYDSSDNYDGVEYQINYYGEETCPRNVRFDGYNLDYGGWVYLKF